MQNKLELTHQNHIRWEQKEFYHRYFLASKYSQKNGFEHYIVVVFIIAQCFFYSRYIEIILPIENYGNFTDML
jgi:hypothetical protein